MDETGGGLRGYVMGALFCSSYSRIYQYRFKYNLKVEINKYICSNDNNNYSNTNMIYSLRKKERVMHKSLFSFV